MMWIFGKTSKVSNSVTRTSSDMGNIDYMHTDYNTNYTLFLKYSGSQMCVGGAGWEQEQRRKKGGRKRGRRIEIRQVGRLGGKESDN